MHLDSNDMYTDIITDNNDIILGCLLICFLNSHAPLNCYCVLNNRWVNTEVFTFYTAAA